MFVLCLALWLIICGNVTWETAGFGVAIAAGVTWLGRRLTGASREKELKMIRKLPAAIRLGGRLFTEIVRANLKVAGMVYREEDPDSCLVTFQAPLRTTAARTVLADCITLTPGTITAGLEGDQYTVHCLDRTMAEGLGEGPLTRRLQAMEEQEAAK